MATYRLVIEYDGTAFAGFQTQPKHETVQSVLEAALSQHFGVPRVIIHGSGRTDAGVHALGQVVSFRIDVEREPHKLRLGLNTALPDTLSVVEAERMPDGFHARYSATGKTYRYRIIERRDRSPFFQGRALHVKVPLDWRRIEAALPCLVGTLDFSSFRGAGCTARTSVRTIDRADHIAVGAGEHWIEFHGDGFLRYQVRRMVGTLVEIGEGRRPADDLPRVLAARDPGAAGRTARAHGLYLLRVDYPPAGEAPALPASAEASDEE